MAYSQILDDERKGTAAGFSERANAFFPMGRPLHSVRSLCESSVSD